MASVAELSAKILKASKPSPIKPPTMRMYVEGSDDRPEEVHDPRLRHFEPEDVPEGFYIRGSKDTGEEGTATASVGEDIVVEVDVHGVLEDVPEGAGEQVEMAGEVREAAGEPGDDEGAVGGAATDIGDVPEADDDGGDEPGEVQHGLEATVSGAALGADIGDVPESDDGDDERVERADEQKKVRIYISSIKSYR